MGQPCCTCSHGGRPLQHFQSWPRCCRGIECRRQRWGAAGRSAGRQTWWGIGWQGCARKRNHRHQRWRRSLGTALRGALSKVGARRARRGRGRVEPLCEELGRRRRQRARRQLRRWQPSWRKANRLSAGCQPSHWLRCCGLRRRCWQQWGCWGCWGCCKPRRSRHRRLCGRQGRWLQRWLSRRLSRWLRRRLRPHGRGGPDIIAIVRNCSRSPLPPPSHSRCGLSWRMHRRLHRRQ
mmetsp:Transcript_51572/g.111854  ORF Transcript_51572/g.111854 Transcript_51572/m.111854 type:complete len:236 (+) Transcript_51572:218-925(+)